MLPDVELEPEPMEPEELVELGELVEPEELELGRLDESELELGEAVLPEAPLVELEPCFAK